MIGCSSFTMITKDQKHFLSRTMDFMMEMAQQVVCVPKNKTFASVYSDPQTVTTKHAFLGMGDLQNYSSCFRKLYFGFCFVPYGHHPQHRI
ncbi:linear amide C-N hydrolase [Bombilactobacillus thymidiniphilus]|uniref:linear amide C-N hydrolase n=1 Tax=Bombilactobacillus thymidiniphilus TaxID=2923363 RepID=UPI0037BFB92C